MKRFFLIRSFCLLSAVSVCAMDNSGHNSHVGPSVAENGQGALVRDAKEARKLFARVQGILKEDECTIKEPAAKRRRKSEENE